MKSFLFIIGMALINRALLWLFPDSDALVNFALLPFGLVGAILIVWSEIKSSKLQSE